MGHADPGDSRHPTVKPRTSFGSESHELSRSFGNSTERGELRSSATHGGLLRHLRCLLTDMFHSERALGMELPARRSHFDLRGQTTTLTDPSG